MSSTRAGLCTYLTVIGLQGANTQVGRIRGSSIQSHLT